ncbi:metal ABC transporter permease, partial [Escherichia coli]|uniref:metal ABC transporter permease n=1 Tax=Escherichia coli TaxID=562 RepID=UPI00288323F3
SGGQKKRVFLARAIAQQGDVILLDEPFTGVDVKTEAKIISLLRELRAEGKTMLVSTHNLGSVTTFCDYTVMVKGTVLASGPTDTTHSIVPGVAGAYMLGLPFSLGAFFSGGLAAGSMLFLNQLTRLKEDAIIGLIFSSFFGLGLFMVSLNPTSVNIQTIVLGNILAIDPADILQLTIIGIL